MAQPGGADDELNCHRLGVCSQNKMAAKGDAVTPKTEEKTAGGDGENPNSPLLLSKDAPEATSDKEPDDGVPYDRGWAWVVVFGCFVNFIILSGYLKSGGVIFVELLRQFQAPVTQTALLFGIRAGVFSISAMYVMNVVASRLGARKTVLIGATVIPLSAIMASLANNLTTLICVQATLTGLGMATLISPGEVLLGAYFKRRRSLAFALAKCGASIGSYIRDISGSYIVVCHVIGCGVLIAAGLLCCEGTVRRLSASSARRESDTMSVDEVIILRGEEPAVEQAAADRREHFQRRRAVSVGAEDVFTKYLTQSCDNRR